MRRSLWYFLTSVFLGLVAFLGALSDIDFFTFSDLFDTRELHHEHIVATVLVIGFIFFLMSFRAFLRENGLLSTARVTGGRERV